MASIKSVCLFLLVSIPVLINSHQMAQMSRLTPLEPSWQSVEVVESSFQPSARVDRYLRHNNRILADPYESYQRVDQLVPSQQYPESSFGKRQEYIQELSESEVSVADGNEDYPDEEGNAPQPAEDRFFLGALAPLALAGLSVPAIATLGIAGAVMLPLAGIALFSGIRRIFNPNSIPDGFAPGAAVLEGPAGQFLGNLLAHDRKITLYNTEYTLTVLTRSTTSVNTVSSLTSTGSTITYLVYYSTATWSSTTTSVSVSTYSSPIPTTFTSSATSSATSLSTLVYSSTSTTVRVLVPVSTEASTYISTKTSVSTTTTTPVLAPSMITATDVQTATNSQTITYTSTYVDKSICSRVQYTSQ